MSVNGFPIDYYLTADTNPGADVWNVATAAYVPVNDATFLLWLISIALPVPVPTYPYSADYPAISAAASNGAGGTRFTVGSGQDITSLTNMTGASINIQGTTTYDGNQTFTFVDSTHFDIAQVFSVNVTSGQCYGARVISTLAALKTLIGNFNSQNWATVPQENSLTLSADTALTVAQLAKEILIINSLGTLINIKFPSLLIPGSVPLGSTVSVFNNTGGPGNLRLENSAGGVISEVFITGVQVNVVPYSFVPQWVASYPASVALNIQNDPFSGALLIGQAPSDSAHPTSFEAITGDVSISTLGVTTVLNIPNDTTMAGDLLATEIAAPAAPAASHLRIYGDSTADNLFVINHGGTKNHMAQSFLASASHWLIQLRDDGSWATSQPTPADLNPNAVATVKKQIFGSSGTYTPSTGMLFCIAECIGGGGGGGATVGSNTAARAGGGGGNGSYARSWLSAATIGASKTVTIGTAGSGGLAGANAGGAGGDTSLGTLVIGKGGSGGNFSDFASGFGERGAGGVAGTGDLVLPGNPGGSGLGQGTITTILANGGTGGAGYFGGAGTGAIAISGSNNAGSNAAVNSGSGGGGAATVGTATNAAGGSGGTGLVVITEFCNQ